MPASTSSVSNASDGGFNTGITTPDQGLIGSSAELDLLRKRIAELQAGQASLLAAQSIARQDSSAVEELTKTLKKAMTVSPEDSEDPDNAGRMISVSHLCGTSLIPRRRRAVSVSCQVMSTKRRLGGKPGCSLWPHRAQSKLARSPSLPLEALSRKTS